MDKRQRQDGFIEKVSMIARNCGYAIAVHGSRDRDLDLIAVPWEPVAIDWPPPELIRVLCEELGLMLKPAPEPELPSNPVPKSHGRLAYALVGAPACQYLDLSVMAPARALPRPGERAAAPI